jgi:hypothetical protein
MLIVAVKVYKSPIFTIFKIKAEAATTTEPTVNLSAPADKLARYFPRARECTDVATAGAGRPLLRRRRARSLGTGTG